MTASKLATFLKKRREALGLSQKQVAMRLGYSSPQFVSNWERGQSAPPYKSLQLVAEIYQTTPEKILQLM